MTTTLGRNKTLRFWFRFGLP